MQDLFQNYVDDLNKLRDAFHDELTVQARELSNAMDIYAHRSDEALASLMEKVSARGVEVEIAAAARLDQFRGLPETAVCHMSVTDRCQTPTNADQMIIEIVAERAVADGLHVESDGDRKPKSGRPMVLVKADPAA